MSGWEKINQRICRHNPWTQTGGRPGVGSEDGLEELNGGGGVGGREMYALFSTIKDKNKRVVL